jgi:uncharacterized protein (TIGR02646 family)
VIKIARHALPGSVAAQLRSHAAHIAATPVARQIEEARKRWSGNYNFRSHVYPALQETLRAMAPGLERCMFCGDSEGTDIDHFEPKSRAPLRTFEWLNHLLACKKCNSENKQNRYPTAADGTALLIDPTVEDPAEHIELVLAAGKYRHLTDKGKTTIDLLDLNRGTLVKGRVGVYHRTSLALIGWYALYDSAGESDEAMLHEICWQQPMADVFDAMLRQSSAPGAEDIFCDNPHILALLRNPKISAVLQRR